MSVNLERGFRRITWVVSVVLLILAGGAIVLLDGLQLKALDDWKRAGELSDESPPLVYVVGLDWTVEFPSGFTQGQIKQALDKAGIEHIIGPIGKTDALNRISGGRGVEEIRRADVKGAAESLRDTIAQQRLPHTISSVYLPSSQGTPSALYSRKTILQLEATGGLPKEAQAALLSLRQGPGLPPPVKKPPTWGNWMTCWGIVCGVAAVPWGMFYLLRWIIHGFRVDV